MRLVKWIFKCIATLGIIGIVVLLGLLRIEHSTATALPMPTGSLPVGRSSFSWTDDAHADSLAPLPGTKRELLTWIWYPAAAGQSDTTMDDYFPDAWRTAAEQYWGTLSSKFLERDRSRVQAHSVRDAAISSRQTQYPVAIMRPGLAALTIEYTTLAEDLASYGYIVVGFDAPYRTQVVVLPDGKVIYRTSQNDPEAVGGQEGERIAGNLVTAWSADIGFALDQLERLNASDPAGKFTGRLDMSHVGVFGHSLGGATAAQFCHDDARCKAGIDIDGAPHGSVIREGIGKPFMFLMSDHSNDTDLESRQIEANIQSIYDRLPPENRRHIMIRGADHFGFSDGAVLKSQIVLRMLQTLGVLGIDGRRQLTATAYYVRNFFDTYLKDGRLSGPQVDSPSYPEIQSLE